MASSGGNIVRFSEKYAQFHAACLSVRETAMPHTEPGEPVTEHVLQCIWYDQLFSETNLTTEEGHRLKVHSPGWWNHQEGPDFRGAQIEFNGKLCTGDVEIHLDPRGWTAHKHHLDSRYDDVILHVVLESPNTPRVYTSEDRAVSTLVLKDRLMDDANVLAGLILADEYPYAVGQSRGKCSELRAEAGPEALTKVVLLAGEWRMLHKARALRERMDHSGANQAIYEEFMYACGFGHFKHHFRAIARHLPYDRARQLALLDPLLLETAFLQIAGLLPENLPQGTTAVPHFARLRALRRDHLGGLRSLPLTWRRIGIRPANNPERRLAGAARFFTRTAREGLVDALEKHWRGNEKPLPRRRAFESLFPSATGFWATHCTWTGKKMKTPSAPLGSGRIRSIIGNVFIPAALALARRNRDRGQEERVYALFQSLPKEPDNHVVKIMAPRLYGSESSVHLNFRLQQGLLQIYQDWCQANPSCHNCTMLRHIQPEEADNRPRRKA